MGAKGQTIAQDILELVLDGTSFTDIDTTALRVRLGTGVPNTTTGQLTAYNTELEEATFDTASASGNWTFAAVGGGSTGSKATNGVAVGNGTNQWENSTTETIAVTEIGIYKATGGAVTNLLYSGSFTAVNVGAGAFVTIAIGGLVITES